MKIFVHDYAGHPFQTALSRELAERGHEIVHAYFASDAGPKGRMKTSPEDPQSLRFLGVNPGQSYSKSNLIARRFGDIGYGRAVAKLIQLEQPDLVLSGNTPTEAQQHILRGCRASGARFVFWCQDFYSIALTRILPRKLPGVGHAVSAYYRALDRSQLQQSDHVVLVTDAFLDQTRAWGVPEAKTTVIPNWGAIDDIHVGNRDNPWAHGQGLGDRKVVLYSGTLALKHNPDLLLALARETTAQVVVVASGVGMDTLQEVKAQEDLPNLTLLPLQPFEDFSNVLASADVLVAVIERDAGEFSVPSKVYSYLCSGRPIVLAAPRDNLAAKVVNGAGAGTSVEPEDADGLVAAAKRYLDDADAAAQAGQAGRRYAEDNFRIKTIGDRFEAVIDKACSAPLKAVRTLK